MRRDYDRWDFENRQCERKGRDDGERGYSPDYWKSRGDCECSAAYRHGHEEGRRSYERRREEEEERVAEEHRQEMIAREHAERRRAEEEEYLAALQEEEFDETESPEPPKLETS